MTRSLNWKLAAAALALPLVAGTASADELLNTGNPGGFLGYFGFDLFTGQSVAIAFTPATACTFQDAKLWIMSNDFDNGGRTYTVTLRASHPTIATQPGDTVIESWTVATGATGWTPVQDIVTSVSHPALAAGTQYWIVAESTEDAFVNPVWLSCDGEGSHPVAFNDHSTGWQGAVQQGGFPGIIVNSTPSGPARCNAADVAGLGGTPGHDGQNTVDDLVYFLSQFFAQNLAVADIAGLGGSAGPDGQITPDDLVAFLGAFFSPCTP